MEVWGIDLFRVAKLRRSLPLAAGALAKSALRKELLYATSFVFIRLCLQTSSRQSA